MTSIYLQQYKSRPLKKVCEFQAIKTRKKMKKYKEIID